MTEITIDAPASLLKVSHSWASPFVNREIDPKEAEQEKDCRAMRKRLSLQGARHNTQCELVEKSMPELWETWKRLFGGYSLGM